MTDSEFDAAYEQSYQDSLILERAVVADLRRLGMKVYDIACSESLNAIVKFRDRRDEALIALRDAKE